jgi:glucosamine-6-phosphate deaminase
MTVRVFRNAGEAARAAAAVVIAQIARKPASVLGLPTGRTSLPVYDELVWLHTQGAADFSRAHTFNIDEFAGVDAFRAFMEQHVFSRINLPADHIHFLDGTSNDPRAECARFEREIASCGGMDLLLLGIGANAHIGFNEPARTLRARTHRARLAIDTRRANAPLFGGRLERVPCEALTMGIATMMEARAIVLIATGRSKAPAVGAMLNGEISTAVPASVLQLHPDCELILDAAAAEQLPEDTFRRSGKEDGESQGMATKVKARG